MNPRVKRCVSILLVAAFLAAGCVMPDGQLAMETFGRGVVNLILSPFMIVAGLAQGIAFLPYTLGTALTDLNRALLEAQAVSLDDSYKATFGVSISDPRVDQETGQVAGQGLYGRYRPEAMVEATRAFQRLLVSQGMPEDRAQHYVLTGVYTHTRTRGHILLSVVYRHPGPQPFRVASKHTRIVTTFRPDQMGWREPYERDVGGRVIDEVIDWAGMEYGLLRNDKVVATLMVLAAESVKAGKRSPDYWEAERRWIAGESQEIMRESLAKVKSAMDATAFPGEPGVTSPTGRPSWYDPAPAAASDPRRPRR
jgi:hypothetical protein